jgi:hypothetical protein
MLLNAVPMKKIPDTLGIIATVAQRKNANINAILAVLMIRKQKLAFARLQELVEAPLTSLSANLRKEACYAPKALLPL